MIREYTDKDFNVVTALGRDIDSTFKLNLSPVSRCFVYEIDEEVVGMIIADIFDDRSEIIDISVDVMYRNRKIGDELVKYIIDLSKDNNCKDITLEVKVNNDAAIKLYKNNNFKVISIRKRYYKDGSIDAYLMQRKL